MNGPKICKAMSALFRSSRSISRSLPTDAVIRLPTICAPDSATSGELRAIGDVLRDQMFYMQRVGFDAFATRPDRNIHDALKGLTDFSDTLPDIVGIKSPLFRRAARDARSARV